MKGAKLWKRVLNEGVRIPDDMWPKDRPKYDDEVRQQIVTSPIIIDPTVQPLGEYHYDFSLYTSLSVPFERFWVEGKMGDRGMWGAKVNAIEHPKHEGWLLQIMYFNAWGGDPINTPGKVFVRILPDGSLDGSHEGNLRYSPAIPPSVVNAHAGLVPGGRNLVSTFAWQSVQCVADVLRMLSCKNVDLETRDPDPKAAKVARKRHGPTDHSYRYHVLVVRPAGARSDAPAQEIGTIPRHVCRGHFAEYGPKYGKGLLFGKHEGRFYVPPHLKGDTKNGQVYKDYEVATPPE